MKTNKFNIGEELWYIDGDEIRNEKVTQISLSYNGQYMYYGFTVEYKSEIERIVCGNIAYIEDIKVFKTKEELIKSLHNEHKD